MLIRLRDALSGKGGAVERTRNCCARFMRFHENSASVDPRLNQNDSSVKATNSDLNGTKNEQNEE